MSAKPKLTDSDWRAIDRACNCEDWRKRGEACTSGPRGWMRCAGKIDKWNEMRRLRGLIPPLVDAEGGGDGG